MYVRDNSAVFLLCKQKQSAGSDSNGICMYTNFQLHLLSYTYIIVAHAPSYHRNHSILIVDTKIAIHQLSPETIVSLT